MTYYIIYVYIKCGLCVMAVTCIHFVKIHDIAFQNNRSNYYNRTYSNLQIINNTSYVPNIDSS